MCTYRQYFIRNYSPHKVRLLCLVVEFSNVFTLANDKLICDDGAVDRGVGWGAGHLLTTEEKMFCGNYGRATITQTRELAYSNSISY